MHLSRRELIKLGLLGGGAMLLPLQKVIGAVGSTGPITSPFVEPFTRPLLKPRVKRPIAGTTDQFVVVEKIVRKEIIPGRLTTLWTYDGHFPGPTFMVPRAKKIHVKFINKIFPPGLEVPTVVHLHGGNTEAVSDGHPVTQQIQPGAFRINNYANDQQAAPLWYHDHTLDETGRNVYMGLAGFYLVTDSFEKRLQRGRPDRNIAPELPSGPEFDVPLVLMDKLFADDGSLIFPTEDGMPLRQGVFGDTILVNGVVTPFLNVQRRKYRFRLLNGSNARVYELELHISPNGQKLPMKVITTAGGFVIRVPDVEQVKIAPSERYGIIVDFSGLPDGTRVTMRNVRPQVFGDPIDQERVRSVMQFRVMGDRVADPVQEIRRDLGRFRPNLQGTKEQVLARSVRTRDFRFERSGGQWVINGLPFDNDRPIDVKPRFGTVEIWRFINNSGGWVHPIHPHLVEFRMLDRNGQPPRPQENGPKDTTFLGPNETIRVAMDFGDFRGIYVFHCHNIEHEDEEMMTQFDVV